MEENLTIRGGGDTESHEHGVAHGFAMHVHAELTQIGISFTNTHSQMRWGQECNLKMKYMLQKKVEGTQTFEIGIGKRNKLDRKMLVNVYE